METSEKVLSRGILFSIFTHGNLREISYPETDVFSFTEMFRSQVIASVASDIRHFSFVDSEIIQSTPQHEYRLATNDDIRDFLDAWPKDDFQGMLRWLTKVQSSGLAATEKTRIAQIVKDYETVYV